MSNKNKFNQGKNWNETKWSEQSAEGWQGQNTALHTKCKTGDVCPENGQWKASSGSTFSFTKGTKFPANNNQSTQWEFVAFEK